MKPFRATFNSINCGNIRVYPTHAANFKFKNPAYAEELGKLRQQEFDLELDTDEQPDYYLVMAWHFAYEFLERERETILKFTAMIFPLPQIKIIDKASLSKSV